jgi:hypothetical protein
VANKRQSVNARLQRALRIRKLVAQDLGPKYRPLPFVPTGLSGPSRDDIWKATAREAFKLTDKDRTIKRAFDTFGLDPSDPWHWRELVEELLSVVFFERKKPGRRKEWSTQRKLELVQAIVAMRRRNPKLSDKRACELLAEAKDSPPYFRKAGTDGLLKQLQFARAETARRSTRRSQRSG